MVDFSKHLKRNKEQTAMPKDNPFGKPKAGQDTDDIEIDLPSEAEEAAKWMVPEGTYAARVIGFEKGTSNSGNPMITWEFEITGPKEFKGKTFKSFTALTPSAMWKLREVLEALGLGQGGQKVKLSRKDSIGKLCRIEIEDDEYDGKPRSSIAKVLPPEAKRAEAAPSDIPV